MKNVRGAKSPGRVGGFADNRDRTVRKALKVAIVHDWLVGGGAERVVYELHRLFPDAPIYTSYATDEWRKKLGGKVVTGFLQRWPFGALRKYIPFLRIWWFSRLDLSGYDLVISSSGNGEATGVRVPQGTTHICYCHSPVHFYWRHYDQYMRSPGFGVFNPIVRLGLRLLVGPLRRWDFKAAQRPDFMIANSTHIQADIKTFYKRDATVIHPPVDVSRFQKAKPRAKRQGFITVGRQVPYKRTDIIIQACTELGLPLVVVGDGPEHAKLRKLAGLDIRFVSHIPHEALAEYLAGAQAFIFAGHEDFGIAPVEALATGTPVIAYQAGGALDYVQPDLSGMFFKEQTVHSLKQALRTFPKHKYSPGDIKAFAEQFDTEYFRKSILDFVKNSLQ